MKHRNVGFGIMFVAAVLAGGLVPQVLATEYFIGTDGDDYNNGLTETTAFETFATAVAQLGAGDTLTVLPGEYQQFIRLLNKQGTEQAPITIRAKIPGLSVLRPSRIVDGFTAVSGTRFIYSVEMNAGEEAFSVVELDTRQVLVKAPSLADMDEFRKSFYYDKTEEILYVHCSDGGSPANHVLSANVLPRVVGGYQGYGVEIGEIGGEDDCSHIIIDGLVVREFSSDPESTSYGGGPGSGIYVILGSSNITIKNCTLLYNGCGIYVRGSNVLIQDNLLIGNMNPREGEVGQLFVYADSSNVTAQGNIALDSPAHGIRFYGGDEDFYAYDNIVRNCQWGLSFKAVSGEQVALRNVAFGCWDGNFIGTAPIGTEGTTEFVENSNTFENPYSPTYAAHTSYCGGTQDPDNCPYVTLNFKKSTESGYVDPLFADPDHLDFRLQSDSTFKVDGSNNYLGAYPYDEYEGTVYFVKPDGDDEEDGTSVATAFETISRAMEEAAPGVTIYLLEGTYNEAIEPSVSGTTAAPITIRGRGKDSVVKVDGLSLSGLSNWRVENIRFIDTSSGITDCSNIVVDRCVFTSEYAGLGIQESQNIWLRRVTISSDGPAIAISDTENCIGETCSEIRITSSILKSEYSTVIDATYGSQMAEEPSLFCEYNDYLPGSSADIYYHWMTSCTTVGDMQDFTGGDHYSFQSDPELVDLTNHAYLTPGSCCVARDGQAENIGAGEVEPATPPEATITEITERDPTPTSMSLTWWTPNNSSATWRNSTYYWDEIPITFSAVAVWAESNPTEIWTVYSYGDLYHRVSLKGLVPGEEYGYQIVIFSSVGYGYTVPSWWDGASTGLYTFYTPSENEWEPSDETYYVSPDGDPEETGDNINEPTTLTAVSDRVKAGDTVICQDGRYYEAFAPAATGVSGAPITLQAQNRGGACLDGFFVRPCGVVLNGKDYVTIDGLVAVRGAPTMTVAGDRAGCYPATVYAPSSEAVEVKNCVLAGGYGSPQAIILREGSSLTVSNCVLTGFVRAVVGMDYTTVNLLGNTWYYPSISNIGLEEPTGTQEVIIKNNLFFGQAASKASLPMVWGEKPTTSDYNAFYFYPDGEDHHHPRYIGYGLALNDGGLTAIQTEYSGALDSHSLEPTTAQANMPETYSYWPPTDYWTPDASLTDFGVAIRNGTLTPTLEMFDPDSNEGDGHYLDDKGENGVPIGARP